MGSFKNAANIDGLIAEHVLDLCVAWASDTVPYDMINRRPLANYSADQSHFGSIVCAMAEKGYHCQMDYDLRVYTVSFHKAGVYRDPPGGTGLALTVCCAALNALVMGGVKVEGWNCV